MHAPSRRGRRPATVPSYRLHKASGQAVVTIHTRTHYLGPFGSEESRRKYGELPAGAAPGERIDPLARSADPGDVGPSVAELCLAYLSHAEAHYVKDGQQTDEVDCYRSLIRVLIDVFGLLALAKFGPNQLRTVRDAMIARLWSRGYINRQINRLRHMVKWGVGQEMVDPSVLERLRAVEPLLAGRSEARETRPRRIVPAEQIRLVQEKIRSQKAKDLMDLQLLTAARPGELLSLTTALIDRTGATWSAQLKRHKTEHFGKARVLAFGPQAQQILAKYLRADAPDAPLFQIRRNTYENIVRRACGRAGVPRFVPHELRHTSGTMYHDRLGFEAARAMLGHSRPDMTAHYTDHMAQKAMEAAKKLG